MRKRLIGIFLCVCFLMGAALPALAEETGETAETAERLSIRTVEQFLTFAENCRLDSYSRDLSVSLEADLDLSGTAFSGIPTFSGTFAGNGHRICGLSLTADGSDVGLFRYLTQTAVVQDLKLQGEVLPGGSRSRAGGIAGNNAGTIRGCSFDGSVCGADNVGGLVGVNALGGILENCRIRGSVCGNHFVGGAAGSNNGVIRQCRNNAVVNNTAQENSVALSDITMDSLLHSESSQTVTDIGGIAGSSSGVIRDCVNLADVGYQHMGYNIGGIAGTQSGYLYGCKNRGTVLGRKEVGGIAGQMEPTALVEYDEDVLQILRRQLSGMSATVSRTASNVQGTAEAVYGQVGVLQGQVEDAKNAVGLLLPDPDNPALPDADSIQAARNTLSSSLSGMNQTLQGMSATTQSAVGTLTNNLYTLQSQISAMSTTLGNVSETVGGSITDVSDRDTDADLNGKVENCANHGSVLADRNVGGIAGAIALENDLDMEEDLNFSGNNSLNFESQLRAVVKDCENTASVSAVKQNAGGIVGWQSMGLVKGSRNVGTLDAQDADYVGGVTGQSTGYIRSCGAKCAISGRNYVGGIAGSATVATDCRSMLRLDSGTERLGGILGDREEHRSGEEEQTEPPISGNYYLLLSTDVGGIDGISYDGLAQPLERSDFFALDALPASFRTATVTFRFADGRQEQISLAAGDALPAARIPALPEKPGFVGRWEGLEEADLSEIFFDMAFDAVYTGYSAVIQSRTLRENGLPVLLVEGAFTADAAADAAPLSEGPALAAGQTLLEAWTVTLPAGEDITAARLCLPGGCDPERICVWVRGGEGGWRTETARVDGSYVVFPMDPGDTAVALGQTQRAVWPVYAGAAALALAAALAVAWCARRRRQKPSGPTE